MVKSRAVNPKPDLSTNPRAPMMIPRIIKIRTSGILVFLNTISAK